MVILSRHAMQNNWYTSMSYHACASTNVDGIPAERRSYKPKANDLAYGTPAYTTMLLQQDTTLVVRRFFVERSLDQAPNTLIDRSHTTSEYSQSVEARQEGMGSINEHENRGSVL